jgi:type IV pilus assembly protein PilC
MNLTYFERISMKEVVILSRQLATLFEAQVSALRIFRLMAAESDNPKLGRKLNDIAESLQGGISISMAFEKHKDIFSDFYIAMVKAGEETGRLDETFVFLADYLDRNYEINQKAKNALVYPAFIIATFITVMVLMLTMVIPKISAILIESGQDIPIYTKVIIAISNFFVDFGFLFLAGLIVGLFFLIKFIRTEAGKETFDEFKLAIPFVGELYKKLYLSRLSDNLNTMLSSGIPMIKALELTRTVVDNKQYARAINFTIEDVKGGLPLSTALAKHEEFPGVLIQMIKVGEETANLASILKTLSKFYRREVISAVDTLVGLIEPVMIIMLALGVGTLLAAVLVPIYNISAAF